MVTEVKRAVSERRLTGCANLITEAVREGGGVETETDRQGER